MRIISGKFKGRKLIRFNKENIKPTTDRTRQSIFNIITSYLESNDLVYKRNLFEISSDKETKIEDLKIDAAGMVNYGEQQVAFYIEAENRQIGDSLKLQVWRNGNFENLTLTLKAPPFGEEMRNSYDKRPEYLIFGGLVFIALNRNYIHSPGNLLAPLAYEHWYREVERPNTRRQQVVILSHVLPASVNSGYTNLHNFIVSSLNHEPVNSLSHLDQMLKKLPLETVHVVFESKWQSLPLVLNYKESMEQHNSILNRYGIEESSYIVNKNH